MTFSVLQWNVLYTENIERVLEVLQKIDADIVCLQELTQGFVKQTHESTWEYLSHKLGYHFRVQEIPIINKDTEWLQGSAVFSRYPITKAAKSWLHTVADENDPNDQNRGYLETKINIDGVVLTVATTHLSFEYRESEDYELQRLLGHIQKQADKYILTGDLNVTPDSARVTELLKHLENAGPSFDVKTWTTKPYVFNSMPVNTLDWRYDYILKTPDIKTVSATPIPTDVSDHLPILATFRLT